MLNFCGPRREDMQLYGNWVAKFWRQLLKGSAKQPAQKTSNPFKWLVLHDVPPPSKKVRSPSIIQYASRNVSTLAVEAVKIEPGVLK
jgi:hypothetical protein